MTNTTKSLFRHFRWYDYAIIFANIASFVAQVATGEYMAAFDRFIIIVLYVTGAWFMNAYNESERENRRLRSELLRR